MMKSKKITQILIILLVFFVLGFSLFAIVKDILSGEGNLPEAAQRNPMVKEAYLFAKEHPELLEKIPCFCGCANMEHLNNKDCFLDEKGNYVKHGAYCGGCVSVALDVKKLYLEGKSLKEIRSLIDKKHGLQVMAMPTPTPPVE